MCEGGSTELLTVLEINATIYFLLERTKHSDDTGEYYSMLTDLSPEARQKVILILSSIDTLSAGTVVSAARQLDADTSEMGEFFSELLYQTIIRNFTDNSSGLIIDFADILFEREVTQNRNHEQSLIDLKTIISALEKMKPIVFHSAMRMAEAGDDRNISGLAIMVASEVGETESFIDAYNQSLLKQQQVQHRYGEVRAFYIARELANNFETEFRDNQLNNSIFHMIRQSQHNLDRIHGDLHFAVKDAESTTFTDWIEKVYEIVPTDTKKQIILALLCSDSFLKQLKEKKLTY